MTNISWNEIQDRAVEFSSKWAGETYEKGESQSFWSDFLSVFGVDRRRHGAYFEYAVKKGNGKQGFIDLFYPAKLLAEQKSGGRDLGDAETQAFDYLATIPDHDLPEAIVVSDFGTFQFIDLDTRKKTEFSLADFPKHVKLFGFLLGQTSKNLAEQDPVNRKVAEAMAVLHNQLRDDNYTGHDLELLLVRLVFLMFADDSGIFDRATILEYVQNRTADDGSDLGSRLVQIFQILNTPEGNRQSSLDEVLASLPYVNGGLFAEPIQTPSFSGQMRRDLIKAMNLDWSKVSPAIFGSMFQGVMDEKERRNLGAHYTSEANILKVIKPLFLDDLYAEFRSATHAGVRKRVDELRNLQKKLASLKFLDPACGCGNFLVITYRELRRLEHKIVEALSKNADQIDMLVGSSASPLLVNVDQMYGIEIEEFPSLIAQTAIWLTDHQMNVEYSRQSAHVFKRIPLTKSATIVNANALTTDWTEIVEPKDLDFILGNPPFNGSKTMTASMRNELLAQFPSVKGAGVLDFVSAWYAKATAVMKQNRQIRTALVSTNSIAQGEQVPILWQHLFNQGIFINFAHQTFKWSNDAKGNAGVYCVIIGFSLNNNSDKILYEYADVKAEPVEAKANNINGYLINASSIFIDSRSKQISNAPPVNYGSFALDDGNYTLSENDAKSIIERDPRSKAYIKPFIGGKELINNIPRYCLWLKDADPSEIRGIAPITERIEKVRTWRSQSKRANTLALAQTPTLFAEIRQPDHKYIAFPTLSSERREYIPISYLDKDTIASNQVYVINSDSLYTFAILTSRLHMAWVATVCGRLEARYRYSSRVVYNNFVWADANDAQKAEIERLAQAVLDARAEYPNASLADLYDPNTMPPSLRIAHKSLDKAVDRLYGIPTTAPDAERVAHLFDLYQTATA